MNEDFNYHFGKMLYKEIEYLQVRNMKLIEENQQLKDRINKAVKLLDEADYEYSSRTEYTNIIINTKEILDKKGYRV